MPDSLRRAEAINQEDNIASCYLDMPSQCDLALLHPLNVNDVGSVFLDLANSY